MDAEHPPGLADVARREVERGADQRPLDRLEPIPHLHSEELLGEAAQVDLDAVDPRQPLDDLLQILGGDDVVVDEHREPVDHVAELPHVPGPGEAGEEVERGRAELLAARLLGQEV